METTRSHKTLKGDRHATTKTLILALLGLSMILQPASAQSCSTYSLSLETCDCWNHVSSMALTGNSHGCTVPGSTSPWNGSTNHTTTFPKMVFCYDMPLADGSDGKIRCDEDFSVYSQPCANPNPLDTRCWVPYIASSNSVISPYNCPEFGRFTAAATCADGFCYEAVWSKDDCAAEDSTAFEAQDVCPAFNKGDANSNYPDPACPGSSPASSVGASLATMIGGFAVALVAVSEFLL